MHVSNQSNKACIGAYSRIGPVILAISHRHPWFKCTYSPLYHYGCSVELEEAHQNYNRTVHDHAQLPSNDTGIRHGTKWLARPWWYLSPVPWDYSLTRRHFKRRLKYSLHALSSHRDGHRSMETGIRVVWRNGSYWSCSYACDMYRREAGSNAPGSTKTWVGKARASPRLDCTCCYRTDKCPAHRQ